MKYRASITQQTDELKGVVELEGDPAEIWQAMPPEVRALMLAAQESGGKVQVVKLSDILGEPETKH